MKGMFCLLGILVSLVILNSAHGQVGYVLGITGAPGECTYPRHKDWINVISFKEGVINPPGSIRTGGGSAGPVQFAELTVNKRIDRSSVILRDFCVSPHPQHPQVVLSCLNLRDETNLYDIVLQGARVISVKTSTDQAAGAITEEVSFGFEGITWKYYPRSADGKSIQPIEKSWKVGPRP
jgi:type VI secretion system Hcp family effector